MKMQFAATALALAISATASAATINFNNASGSYSSGGVTATVTATGGALYYSSANTAIGVGSGTIDGPLGVGAFGAATTAESLKVTFSQAVTLNSISFAQWSNSIITGVTDSVTMTYTGGSKTLANSGSTVGVFSPNVTLTSFTLTPNQGGFINPTQSTSTFLKSIIVTPSAVPVPAAAWLMGSGLVGLAGLGRRRKTAV